MKTWQIITYAGITVGTVEAITAQGAIEKMRMMRDQFDCDYDRYWVVDCVVGNKILLKK